MTRKEYIEKYGEESYNKRLERTKAWKLKNSEHNQHLQKRWHEKNKKYHNDVCKQWNEEKRKIGWSCYCKIGYELIENYNLAKADDFNSDLWELHHRDESFYKFTTLQKNGQYYNLTPDKLIWLPADEHRSDASLAVTHPEQSKWHQHSLDK